MLHRSTFVDIATIVLLLGAYLLLAGEISATECIAAAIAVPATAALILARRRNGNGRLAFTAPAPTILRPLVALLPDTVEVGRALALAIRFGQSRPKHPGDPGAFIRQPPPPPEPVGSKGLRILSQSLTPKSFVLGETNGAELLHRLTPDTPKGDAA
jgi:hypothetical protein